MKQVFKCEYCDFMGTKEQVLKHEESCIWNYNKRDCHTCKHQYGIMDYKCEQGVDIPRGCLVRNCGKYERADMSKQQDDNSIIGNLFKSIL